MCFRRVFVCNSSDVVSVWQYGQFIAQHYSQGSGLSSAESSNTPQRSLHQAPTSPTAVGEREVRVVFHQREWEARQLLTLPQLLQACNSSRLALPGNVTAVLRCEAVRLPTVADSVAAAQRADVFVGVHGASLAGSWFMRPGSAVVEILPYQAGRFPYAEMTLEVRLRARRVQLGLEDIVLSPAERDCPCAGPPVPAQLVQLLYLRPSGL